MQLYATAFPLQFESLLSSTYLIYCSDRSFWLQEIDNILILLELTKPTVPTLIANNNNENIIQGYYILVLFKRRSMKKMTTLRQGKANFKLVLLRA